MKEYFKNLLIILSSIFYTGLCALSFAIPFSVGTEGEFPIWVSWVVYPLLILIGPCIGQFIDWANKDIEL